MANENNNNQNNMPNNGQQPFQGQNQGMPFQPNMGNQGQFNQPNPNMNSNQPYQGQFQGQNQNPGMPNQNMGNQGQFNPNMNGQQPYPGQFQGQNPGMPNPNMANPNQGMPTQPNMAQGQGMPGQPSMPQNPNMNGNQPYQGQFQNQPNMEQPQAPVQPSMPEQVAPEMPVNEEVAAQAPQVDDAPVQAQELVLPKEPVQTPSKEQPAAMQAETKEPVQGTPSQPEMPANPGQPQGMPGQPNMAQGQANMPNQAMNPNFQQPTPKQPNQFEVALDKGIKKAKDFWAKNKRNKAVSIGVPVLLIAGIVGSVVYSHRKVNLLSSDMMKMEFKGYNNHGSYSYNWVSYEKEAFFKIAKRNGVSKETAKEAYQKAQYYSDVLDGDAVQRYIDDNEDLISPRQINKLENLKDDLKSLKITFTKNGKKDTENLKNGDELEVTVTQTTPGHIKQNSKKFKVKGLKAQKKVSLASLSKDFTVEMSGINGSDIYTSKRVLSGDLKGIAKSNLPEITIPDKPRNGQKIEVTAKSFQSELEDNNPDIKFTGKFAPQIQVAGLVEPSKINYEKAKAIADRKHQERKGEGSFDRVYLEKDGQYYTLTFFYKVDDDEYEYVEITHNTLKGDMITTIDDKDYIDYSTTYSDDLDEKMPEGSIQLNK